MLSEGRNKLGRLVVELAILVSLPRWAPVGGEEDHPEAEFFYLPRHIHFLWDSMPLAFLVAVSFGPATGMKADER